MANFFSNLFGGTSNTQTQVPMMTPEQLKALQMLSQVGQTGSGAGLTLGDPYGGSLGNFDATGTEGMAGNNLYSLIQSGQPAGYGTARDTLTGLTNNQFNPDNPSSGYAAYSRQVQRAGQTGLDALNRDAAITGDRFSTSLGRDKSNLFAQQSDVLATKLGELYNSAQDRSLQAAQGLGNLETQVGANERNNIASGMQYGGLSRLLANQEAQAKLQEFTRQRSEKLGQLDILQNVFNKNVPYDQMNQTVKAPSLFSQLLNTALTGAASAFGGPVGGALASGATSLFSNLFKKPQATYAA